MDSVGSPPQKLVTSWLHPEASQMEPEQQAVTPMTVWCGGINADQDVSIRLVPNGINQQQVTDLRSQEPLAVLKVHSTRLKKHSKYFQACLSKRWTHADANPSPPSMEFNLEVIHGLQVASYTDCFSRMYMPLRKNFKDVKSSLELLRVASQIEFLELVNPICRYLSTILWCEEDELRIRHFSSFPDFPRSQAEDLVARLQIGEHGNEDYRKKLLSHQIAHSIRIALSPPNGNAFRESFLSAQSLFEDLFSSIGQSEIDSAFENDVVTIFSKEVNEMLESFHEACRKRARFHTLSPGKKLADIDVERVSGFEQKLKALCWALELLLKTQVAEEVIECFLHLELFYAIIMAAQVVDSIKPASERVTIRFAKLVILIFREAVAGRLLLTLQDRVLLFESWKYFYVHLQPSTQNDILVTWGFGQAVEHLFLTLPLEQQMETLQRSKFTFHGIMCRRALITLMKRNWPAEDLDALLHAADTEADVQAGVQLS